MTHKEGVVIGGGPSVTQEQLDAVREWQGPDRIVMVVNKGFEKVPWADYVFSRDTQFLHKYQEELEDCGIQLVVGNVTFTPPWAIVKPTTSYISGSAAIEALAMMGCLTIYLIGADGHHNGGTHWFEDYKTLKNAPNIKEFDNFYTEALQIVGGVEVYNLSPGTAIEAIPTMDFKEWQTQLL